MTIEPRPTARRQRPMAVEPMVFAMLLAALTLGINLALSDTDAGHDAAQQTPASHPAGAQPTSEPAGPTQAAKIAGADSAHVAHIAHIAQIAHIPQNAQNAPIAQPR